MAEKKYDKARLLVFLDRLNTAFHNGLLTLEEKNGLLYAIRTHLSDDQESMLLNKLNLYPDAEIITEIMGFFVEERRNAV